MRSAHAKIDDLIVAERRERALASALDDNRAKDRHVMAAERLADRAWSLAEATPDAPAVKSTLWNR